MTPLGDDPPGWPAVETRVSVDPSRIGPLVLRSERRAEQREAHRKWLEKNPEKMRAARAAWREARRAE